MKITRMRIENFRSIKELDFEPRDYSVLIGENNSGKSNILRALNLVLGEIWPSERSFSEEDFHNQDTSSDIVIQVFFDETIEDYPNGFRVEIAGFELRCKAYKRRVKKKPAGSLKVDYLCIDKKGKQINYPASALKKGERYTGKWFELRVSNDRREQIPLIFVDVLREYDKHTPSGRWSVLRRLFNEVNKEFINDKAPVKVTLSDGSTANMTRKQAFEYTVKDAYKFLRTASFTEIEQKLAANALDQMGIEPDEGDVTLKFESHDPTNAYKSLQLYVDELGISSPASEVGSGLQSAIVVAIFRTYEELRKEGAIFTVEEPEVFLHPQKARYFESVLQSLSERGNQVFVTTHSPIFVQIHKPETVAIVRRTREKGTYILQRKKSDLAVNERKALRLLTEFDSQRKELFFARKVVLVEGNTEKVALPLVFREMGIDINKNGISIIECGGKTQIPFFAKVLNSLNIPYICFVDHDIKIIDESWSEKRKQKELENNKRHRKWNQQIEAIIPTGRYFYFEPNFEKEFGLSSNQDLKIDQAIQFFSSIKKEDIPKILTEPLNELLSLR